MLTVFRYQVDDETSIKSACRVATGRSAILHMAQRWRTKVVFMPAYVPEGVILPFIRCGAQIVFYKLDHWLSPDFGDLTKKLEANKVERPVIVLIHYFGMRMSIFETQKIARKHGGIVLSDCSHCVPYGDNYWKSDVTLYSLNKFLPVTDGALLSSRRDDLDVSLSPTSELTPLPSRVRELYQRHLDMNRTISQIDEYSGIELAESRRLSNDFYERYYAAIRNDMACYTQSALSRSIEAQTDLGEMKSRRLAKSAALCNQLALQFFMHDQACQFAFPITCNGRRDLIAHALGEMGILTSICMEKWDHLPNSGYDIERRFIDDHLLLPIGEDVEHSDIATMADVINSFARRGA